MVLIGFIFIPFWGEMIGLIVGFIIHLSLIIIGDKLMLAAVRAKKPMQNKGLANTVSNLACRLGLEKVEVYKSFDYPNNVYFMQPLLGNPSIVVGQNLLEKISKEEVNALIFSALIRIKLEDARYRTICSLVLGFFYFPFYLLLKTPLGSSRFVLSLVSFLIFPLRILRHVLLNPKRDIERYDQETINLLEDPSSLASAHFKLTQLLHNETSTLADAFMESISLGENKKSDVLSSVLRPDVSPYKRYDGIGYLNRE